MPLEKIRQLEERAAELEEQIRQLTEHEDHTQQLITKTDRLALSTDALTGVLRLFQEQTGAIRAVDTKADGIRKAGEDSRTKIRRALVGVGLVVLGLVVFAVVGTRQVNAAHDAARDARALARQARVDLHANCVSTNARLQVTITREQNLARTDLPATHAAHQESAESLRRAVENCNAKYPLN